MIHGTVSTQERDFWTYFWSQRSLLEQILIILTYLKDPALILKHLVGPGKFICTEHFIHKLTQSSAGDQKERTREHA